MTTSQCASGVSLPWTAGGFYIKMNCFLQCIRLNQRPIADETVGICASNP
jgi:hypothetical protein